VFISRKCPHNENNNARKMTVLNGISNRRGRPSVKTPVLHNTVARVFRIWGDLEIAHGHFQDPEMAQPSRDGWAVSGFWAISRWAKGVFRILNIGGHR